MTLYQAKIKLANVKSKIRRIRDNLISSVEVVEFYNNKKDFGLRYYIGELYDLINYIDKEKSL